MAYKRFYSCFDPFRMLAYSSKLGKINPAGREFFKILLQDSHI